MKDSIKIAKEFSAGDWKELRAQLLFLDNNWNKAIQVFEDRIHSRFFIPIDKIIAIGKNEGEGFSIALISVVLLELLAAFELGKIFRVKNDDLAPHEYCSGSRLLRIFLTKDKIFSRHFYNYERVQKFYEDVRCGLVHEARTLKNDVIISSDSIKNTKGNAIYFKENEEWRFNRDVLLETIKTFVKIYKERILNNEQHLRNKFLMKMDDIAGLKHVWYFVYGSNLHEEQLKRRLKSINEVYLQKERSYLEGYDFIYNKRSIDGSSKGNLIKKENSRVEGIAILILDHKLEEFIEKWEKGYKIIDVKIQKVVSFERENTSSFCAYTCISEETICASPQQEYVAKIIHGAKENGLPDAYIQNKLMHSSSNNGNVSTFGLGESEN